MDDINNNFLWNVGGALENAELLKDKWTIMDTSKYGSQLSAFNTGPLATFNARFDVTFSPTYDKSISFYDDGELLVTGARELIGLLRARPADLVTAREELIAARTRIAELEAKVAAYKDNATTINRVSWQNLETKDEEEGESK